MIRKKKSLPSQSGEPELRSRTPVAKRAKAERNPGDNPLARRFRQDSEPPTIDLAAAPRFQVPRETADPKTAPLPTGAAQLSRFISREPETGKFYIHPGPQDLPVTLQGEPVSAPTELRRGDVIRIGDAEFHFRFAS